MTTEGGAFAKTADKDRKPAVSVKYMTPEALHEACKERDMWTQPHLNTRLYLNYKGFDNIGGLESYVGVKTLHLGNNNIAKIEGLERMHDLRCLFLENNRIASIDNLHNNLMLRQLNLEGNALRAVTNLTAHTKLEQISLAHNSIESLEDISELLQLQSLSNVDVSNNQLQDVDGVVDFWAGFSGCLRLLRYHQNPGVRNIEHYRKRLVNALPLLGYLDERPVFPVERKAAKAWSVGGKEAMEEAKRQHFKEKNQALQVDPERRELLTRMRKMAIERIDREEKEREQQEAERRQAQGAPVPPSAVSGGDSEALDNYASKWRNKVSLYGSDGLREKVAKEDSAASGAARRFAPPPRGADAEAAATFAPPPRGTAPEVAAAARVQHEEQRPPPPERPAEEPEGQRPATASRRLYRPPADASDFRAGAGGRTQDDRQFSVLGGDENMDLGASGPLSGRGPATGAAGHGRSGSAAGAAAPVVPLIFEQSKHQAGVEEMRCFDLNMANSHRTPKVNDLADLD